MYPAGPQGVPPDVMSVLEALWSNGHAAYLVGGGVRDPLLGRTVTDWDVATDARPERILQIFRNGRNENRFGTVTVPGNSNDVQVTTFRRDHQYGDHRRPDSVTFTDSISEDLARRDFTVNALAWGRAGDPATSEPHWVDPTNGLADLHDKLLRAVGDPQARFDEDALRLLRAARLSAQLGFAIEPATLAAMPGAAETIKWVSGERVGDELRKMIAADPPSAGFAVLAQTRVLRHALPELDAQRGVPQDKVTGHDLWGHALATLDAAADIDPPNRRLRLAALLHDIGKPPTFADGHFIGHDAVGAELADALLSRLAFPRREVEAIVALIANHMFSYERRWSSAAVRRFIKRVGHEPIDTRLVEDQLKLRQADNVGSGLSRDAGGVDELADRVRRELETGVPLTLGQLAVNGDDLMAELGLTPGPDIGWMLDRLLSAVIADPARNNRADLVAIARDSHSRRGAER